MKKKGKYIERFVVGVHPVDKNGNIHYVQGTTDQDYGTNSELSTRLINEWRKRRKLNK